MSHRAPIRLLRRRAVVFRALGHPDRRRIVADLAAGGHWVRDLVGSVGSGRSTVSLHHTVRRQAGVVADEKRGLRVSCRLALPCVAA